MWRSSLHAMVILGCENFDERQLKSNLSHNLLNQYKIYHLLLFKLKLDI